MTHAVLVVLPLILADQAAAGPRTEMTSPYISEIKQYYYERGGIDGPPEGMLMVPCPP